jgi:hypothetical protein
MEVIPYTTSAGVKIGSRWNESPKPMPIDDPDMELIQSLLICSGNWHRQRKIERYARNLSYGTALVIVILFMLVQK